MVKAQHLGPAFSALCRHDDHTDYDEAVKSLTTKRLDSASVLEVLKRTRDADDSHRRLPRHISTVHAWVQRRRRVRSALIQSLRDTLRLYEETVDTANYRLERLEVYRLSRALLDAVGTPPSLGNPDGIMTDVPEPALRKATRGPRQRGHVQAARAELRALRVPAPLATVLLRGIGAVR